MVPLNVNIHNELIQQKIKELVELKLQSKNKNWTPGKDTVQYSGSLFDEEEYIAGIDAFLDGWLALGENGIKFENRFSPRLGKEYGALTNSGSSANLLMVSSLSSKKLYNLPKGSKIITPVAGFPTTVNPILQNGFEPIFIDIEIETLNLNIQQLEQAAKQGASALIFAHVLGNPPNMDEVMSIVDKYNLILLEDCCDALGSTYDNKLLGSFGEMSSCSFYPAHHMTMGEGGFVACKNKQQEIVIKSLREWGRGCYCSGKAASCLKNGLCKKRFSNWIPSLPDEIMDHKYVYEEIGYNLKPLELQAASGLVQLNKLNKMIEIRKNNFNRLYSIFSKYENIFHLPRATEKSDPSWFAFPLTIKDGVYLKRNNFTMYLEECKIQTRNYFGGNLLLQPAYSKIYSGNPKLDFPVATKVTTDTFFLGTSPVITDQQLDYIEEKVNVYFDTANNVRV
jgi:CDP-6-deoxy-D-xylo-4-hexulose-3-dehydrase